MDSGDASPSHESELDDFQRHVSDLFQNLVPAESGELLSLAWIQKLLDTFLCCLKTPPPLRLTGTAPLGRPKQKEPKSFDQFRSLSWSVSRSWSAAKQLQAIGSSIIVPRSNETASTDGLNVAVFTMNHIVFFVMWALVAAIPCQDRGHPAQFYVSRQYLWAAPIVSLHDKIIEESRKQGRRNSAGLLKEIQDIEKCVRDMNALVESVEFPLNEESEGLVKRRVAELKVVYEAVKPGFDDLDRHIREVFHRIVRTKTEGLESPRRT